MSLISLQEKQYELLTSKKTFHRPGWPKTWGIYWVSYNNLRSPHPQFFSDVVGVISSTSQEYHITGGGFESLYYFHTIPWEAEECRVAQASAFEEGGQERGRDKGLVLVFFGVCKRDNKNIMALTRK